MNIERRIACVAEEIRVEKENDEIRLTGLAVAYNSLSEDLGGFRERVMPGAFRETLDTGAEVKALIGHDATKVIGSRQAKTLILRDGDDGLRVSIKLPRTTYAADLAESIRRGDQGRMSFGFATRSDNFHKENGEIIRDLIAADLFEVSAVAWPAYASTSIDVAKRSMQEWLQGQESEAVSWLPGPDLLRRELELRRRRPEVRAIPPAMRECAGMCLECQAMCETCGDAVYPMYDKMEAVLRACYQCAQACRSCARMLATGATAGCEVCAKLCEQCVAACDSQQLQICKECSQVASQCAEMCRTLVGD